MSSYKNIITIEPGKRGGKPCIRGLRITVYDVLESLANGLSQDDIIQDFPELQPEDIKACLAFAAERENQRRIMEFIISKSKKTPSGGKSDNNNHTSAKG